MSDENTVEFTPCISCRFVYLVEFHSLQRCKAVPSTDLFDPMNGRYHGEQITKVNTGPGPCPCYKKATLPTMEANHA